MAVHLPRALRSRSSLTKVILPLAGLYLIWHVLSLWMHTTSIVPIYRYEDQSLPPIYPALRDRERRLPQHRESLRFPEGKGGRYLRFNNQLWGVGLNNQLQETFLNTYIAHLSNRAYVFTPFTWNLNENEFVEIEADSHLSSTGYKVRPARVPLTAYLNAPTTGKPWPPGDATPRAVSLEWWDHICPEKDQYLVNTTEVNAQLGIDMATAEGAVIIEKWSRYLRDLDHGCVKILWGTPRIIDYDLVGSDRLESIWPEYSKSPVLTQFDWSPLVHSAVDQNLHLLTSPHNSRIQGSLKELQYIPGLVTMHVRRGDYQGHCKWMAPFGEFNGWNKLSFLPDRWHPPWSTPTEPGEARAKYAYERCWIDTAEIVARLSRTRVEHAASTAAPLETVFLSTNGDQKWVEEVREALKGPKGVGWRVVTSRGLRLDWQQQGVDMAVDMEIAARGEVFIGNGFSSMSSTVTRVRLVRGLSPASTRFW